MRLLKESVLQIWKARKAVVRDEIATAERTAKAIQEKLDRLPEALRAAGVEIRVHANSFFRGRRMLTGFASQA